MNKDRGNFYGYPATNDYGAFLKKMRGYYDCDDCPNDGNNGCGSWQLGGWEFNDIDINAETGEEVYGKPERVEGWYCTRLIERNNEMNANEIFEYAKDAFSLIRKTDDATSTAALEIAKAGALVSIADSLRVIAYEIADGVKMNAEIELTRGGEEND